MASRPCQLPSVSDPPLSTLRSHDPLSLLFSFFWYSNCRTNRPDDKLLVKSWTTTGRSNASVNERTVLRETSRRSRDNVLVFRLRDGSRTPSASVAACRLWWARRGRSVETARVSYSSIFRANAPVLSSKLQSYPFRLRSTRLLLRILLHKVTTRVVEAESLGTLIAGQSPLIGSPTVVYWLRIAGEMVANCEPRDAVVADARRGSRNTGKRSWPV